MIQSMTDADYHAHPALGRSGMWTLHTQTPAHYRAQVGKDTSSLRLGKVAHAAILEPETFGSRFVQALDLNKNTNAYKDWRAKVEGDGFTVVNRDDYDAALRIRDAVWANKVAADILSDGVFEQAAFAVDEETGVNMKCKPDIWNPRLSILADIKTARSAAPGAFARSCAQYGYHLQEPVYSTVWEAASGAKVNGFAFIVVEPEEPHLVAIYELTPADFELGFHIMGSALKLFAECERTGEWPGYPAEVVELSLPAWAHTQGGE